MKKAEEEVQSLSSDHVDTNDVIDAYMTLANFCDSHLCKEGSAGGLKDALLVSVLQLKGKHGKQCIFKPNFITKQPSK